MANKLSPIKSKRSVIAFVVIAVLAALGMTLGAKSSGRKGSEVQPAKQGRSARKGQSQPIKQGWFRRHRELLVLVSVTFIVAALMLIAEMKVLPTPGKIIFGTTLAPLIGLTDIIGATIIFVAVVAGMEGRAARRFACKAIGYSVLFAVAGAVVGPLALEYMGIPISAFTVVGGYVFWRWGVEEINKPRPKSALPESEPTIRQKLYVPLAKLSKPFKKQDTPQEAGHVDRMTPGEFAFPLIMGPGVISFMIDQEGKYQSLSQYVGLALAVAFVLAALLLCMLFAPLLLKILKERARHALSIIVGYLLMGFAVVMVGGGSVTFILETLNSPPAVELIAEIIKNVGAKVHGA